LSVDAGQYSVFSISIIGWHAVAFNISDSVNYQTYKCSEL